MRAGDFFGGRDDRSFRRRGDRALSIAVATRAIAISAVQAAAEIDEQEQSQAKSRASRSKDDPDIAPMTILPKPMLELTPPPLILSVPPRDPPAEPQPDRLPHPWYGDPGEFWPCECCGVAPAMPDDDFCADCGASLMDWDEEP